MTKQAEYEGKDLEDALAIAATGEGIPESELHYEIVEQGRRGVFGLGAKSLRIRIKPPLERVHLEAEEQPLPATRNETKTPVRAQPTKSSQKRPEGRGRSRRSRQRGPRRETPRAELSGEPTRESEAVAETLRQMVELMGLELEVKSAGADGRVAIDLQGKDREMLMSRNAELLSSMQFLLNRMSRRTWPEAGRIDLGAGDDDGSRRRDDDLVELAREVAQQVLRTGKTKKLQPMNAYERRLVHLTVREFSGLSSSSDGDGSLKSVRISKVQNVI